MRPVGRGRAWRGGVGPGVGYGPRCPHKAVNRTEERSMHRIVVAMASRSDREHCESRRHSLDHGVDPGVVWGGRAGWAGPRAGRSGVRSTGIPATLGLVAVLFSVGCGAGERGSAGPVVRDSAGIVIIENAAPLWGKGEEWRVAAEPLVDIGVL